MRRWLLTPLAALSLLLMLASLFFWIRGHTTWDQFSLPTEHTSIGCASGDGTLFVSWSNRTTSAAALSWGITHSFEDQSPTPPPATIPAYPPTSAPSSQPATDATQYEAYLSSSSVTLTSSFTYTPTHSFHLPGLSFALYDPRTNLNMRGSIYISYWLTTLLFSLLPATWLLLTLKSRRTRLRAQHNLCPHCGYDLRATPNRCPECGHSITARA